MRRHVGGSSGWLMAHTYSVATTGTSAGKIAAAWKESPGWLRRVSKQSRLLALILGVVGFYVDAVNWDPADWGLFVNSYSSVVAFLFGVPVALVGLNSINQEIQRYSEINQAEEFLRQSWLRFSIAVNQLCTDSSIEAVTTRIDELRVARIIAYAGIHEWINSPRATLDRVVVHTELEKSAVAIERALQRINAELPATNVLNHRWLRLQGEWSVIDTMVRERRYGLGLTWLTDLKILD
jgi:hypothetical protein